MNINEHTVYRSLNTERVMRYMYMSIAVPSRTIMPVIPEIMKPIHSVHQSLKTSQMFFLQK